MSGVAGERPPGPYSPLSPHTSSPLIDLTSAPTPSAPTPRQSHVALIPVLDTSPIRQTLSTRHTGVRCGAVSDVAAGECLPSPSPLHLTSPHHPCHAPVPSLRMCLLLAILPSPQPPLPSQAQAMAMALSSLLLLPSPLPWQSPSPWKVRLTHYSHPQTATLVHVPCVCPALPALPNRGPQLSPPSSHAASSPPTLPPAHR